MAVPAETTSFRAALARLTWMFLGPIAAFVSGIGLFTRSRDFLTLGDLFFLLAVGAMLAARWLEFQSGNATTATGDPITSGQVRRYMLVVGLGGLLVWAVSLLLRVL